MKSQGKHIILILMLVALISCSSTDDKMTIGLVLPLTGPGANVGESFHEGFLLGINEGIQVETQDSESSSKMGIRASLELINAEEVDVLIPLLSSVAVPLTDIAEENGIPMIASSASEDDLVKRSEYAFRVFPKASQEADLAAHFAQTKGWKRIATVNINTEYGVSMQEHFKETFNGTIVAEEKFELKEVDFKTILAKVSHKNPDAIYFVGYPLHQLNVVQERKRLGIDIPLLAPMSMTSSFVKDGLGEHYDNIYATTTAAFVDSFGSRRFNALYEERYGKKPDFPASFGYDIANILNEVDHQNMMDGLRGVSINGLNGQLSFDTDGEAFTEMVVIEAVNGTSKVLEK